MGELVVGGLNGSVPVAPNVLADRYASIGMREIFSEDTKILLERDLWITVMEEQRRLGLNIPAEAIEAYKAVRGVINKDSIRERELANRHDVNARLEEFNALAGYQHAHKGMTSRDLTENVEQLQIRLGLDLICTETLATLGSMARLAAEHASLPIAARTHNVVRLLATKTLFNQGHQYFGGCQEWQIAIQLSPDHLRVDAKSLEYMQRTLE